MDGGYAGLSRPSMASEALGLLPGEMQEQFSAPPWMAGMPASLGHPWPPRHLGSCPAKCRSNSALPEG